MSNNTKVLNYSDFLGERTLTVDLDLENLEFVEFCVNVINKNEFIIVEYNEGWESLSGIFSDATEERGFEKIFKIGTTLGSKELLEISSNLSHGGDILTTNKAAIKSYRIATYEDVLYNKLLRVEEVADMPTTEFISEFYIATDEDYVFEKEAYLEYSQLILELSI